MGQHNMKENESFILSGNELKPVTRVQKIEQWFYGVSEPYILKFADYMLADEKRREMYVKMAKPKPLPSGIVISTEAACRFVDFIYSQNAGNNTARMAVTKCVCQTALKKCREPQWKDMALLYLADMMTTMKHTGIKEKFIPIETAEEAKEKLRYFDECGLVHNVLYCHENGKWTFVMCNCDDEICVPYRSYMAGRTSEMSAGPELIHLDSEKCQGCDTCSKCVSRCIFKANAIGIDGKSTVDPTKCLGCGLCVTTCPSGARMLVPRADYQHEDVLTTRILLGEK